MYQVSAHGVDERMINVHYYYSPFLVTGTGYRLIIVKTTACDVREVGRVIRHSIPSARLDSDINAELTFVLPDDQTAKFPALFRTLDKRKLELGIRSFGVNASTMEEVFLKYDIHLTQGQVGSSALSPQGS